MKAVIVEDEQASRETLASYLASYCPDVELAGMADGVKNGLQLINSKKPDIVFLDIEMPFGNGFDLLEEIGEPSFEVVFITAFSEYALKAIQVSASHYLLKPISIDELMEAVEAIKANLQKRQEFIHTRILVENINLENRQLHKIVLPTMEGFEVVTIRDIIYCAADDNFTVFNLQDGQKKMICRSLKYYEQILSEFDFLRVHKSSLINKHYVQRYRKGKGGTITMSNGDEIDVSASRKKDFLDSFGAMK